MSYLVETGSHRCSHHTRCCSTLSMVSGQCFLIELASRASTPWVLERLNVYADGFRAAAVMPLPHSPLNISAAGLQLLCVVGSPRVWPPCQRVKNCCCRCTQGCLKSKLRSRLTTKKRDGWYLDRPQASGPPTLITRICPRRRC